MILLNFQGIAKTNEFKNILHDLNLNKVTDGTFKVVLGTEIPYTDEIKIVKKSENKKSRIYIFLKMNFKLLVASILEGKRSWQLTGQVPGSWQVFWHWLKKGLMSVIF